MNPYSMNAWILILFMENHMIVGYKIYLVRISMILIQATRRKSGRARSKETVSTIIGPKGSYNTGGGDPSNIDNKSTISI
jgi:hypothetical protein